MHIQVPHKFGQQTAVERVKQALEQVKVNPQVKGQLVIEKEEWEENKLTFAFTGQGQHITGTLVVDEKEFIVDAKLPLMLRMFESRIEKMIGEQVKQML